ncbi:hypothetical protein JR316_0004576 [Psilocybe cubensis]|uniref:Uncharacterized protein n=1 Tax=Psilocybe cubensis TaxID=181762 RepID=A0ACB8H3R0_PSICU|nr:hypothetical protein JR316_0004576 [Psilocybe cubensis]KAH9482476.1 hypothetical protein JR316_0004576 [Psilocybe cubensis]
MSTDPCFGRFSEWKDDLILPCPEAHAYGLCANFGAAYIGVVAAGVLYGVSFVQATYYFIKYRQDVWYIKTLVGAVWFFETVHQVLISHTVYYYVITNYNNPNTLGDIVWSVLLEVLFNGLIGLLVQGFLTLRVWKRWCLSAMRVMHVIEEFYSQRSQRSTDASCAFTVQSMKLHTWVELGELKGLSMAVNLLGAVADVVIAAALFFFLHSSRTGFKNNSVLATLNARESIRKLGEDSDELSFSLQSLAKSGQRNPNSARSTNISIKIDTMHDYNREHGMDMAEPGRMEY